MKNIYYKSTNQVPKIDFNCNGNLLLEGRSYPENVNIIFNPLIEWTKSLKAENVTFNINLEYINSASSKKMIELLKCLDSNDSIKKLSINWYYEEGDDDSLETGQIYEELLYKAEFKYLEYAEAAA